MNTLNDTILAVSTAWGSSPRAIIRISGPDALSCASGVFTEDSTTATDRPAQNPNTYRSLKGRIDLGNKLTAPAFLYIMKAPRSYTREDVVEIHTLGSPPLIEMLTEQILQRTRTNGASSAGTSVRMAEPGEFTRRAFLNGRIDIVQAEAVLRVIRSRTDAELRLATDQLEGGLSRRLKTAHERIAGLLSLLEASIDFSDQDISPVSDEEALDELAAIRELLLSYSRDPEGGKVHSGGVKTVLLGPPNAGKSSLFNALLGRPRAITGRESGTTRDCLGAELVVDGITFSLMDTAGVVKVPPQNGKKSDADTDVETLSMDMTTRAANTSALLILVLDGSKQIEKSDRRFIQSLNQHPNNSGRILVINKMDLPQKLSIENLPSPWHNSSIIYTSAIAGSGIGELKEKMAEKIIHGGVDCSASPSLLNARQRALLNSCRASIEQAIRSLENEASAEFTALDVREASDMLGELLGKITTEDILEKIFSQFCIGK